MEESEQEYWGACTMEELCDMQAPDWLVHDWLPEHGTCLLYGKSGTGKSFVVCGIGYAVLTGSEWHGHAVKQGSVVYVATEGHSGLGKRFRALRQRQLPEASFLQLKRPVNLLKKEDVDQFIRFLRGWVHEQRMPLRLIVLDTLNGCMPDVVDELNPEFTRAINGAKRIVDATGALVLLVHHTGRNGQNPRGGYALECNTDVRIRVGEAKGHDLAAGRTVKLYNEKQREDEKTLPLTLRAELVTLPRVLSEAGRKAPTSLVLVDAGDVTEQSQPNVRQAYPKGAIGALLRALDRTPGQPVPGPILAKSQKCSVGTLYKRISRANRLGYRVDHVEGGYLRVREAQESAA